ncbi:MAG TPA: metallophosphoesterase, partial [Burkholderiaceae bacterium]|nr:metallophosphoesterase [Burkholderiaceae bacterium]
MFKASMPSRILIFVVLSLLGLLHVYIGWRILPDLPLPEIYKILGAVWLALSCVLVPAGLLSRAIERQPLSDRLAWVGMLAMGFFSSLLLLTIFRDLALAVAALFNFYNLRVAQDTAFLVPVLTLAVTLLGYLNARRVAGVVHVDVPIAKLPLALHGFTIAQISDIHVGPTIKGKYLDAIVKKVNQLKPDMIAVTGDLVDGSVAQLQMHTASLGKLSARHGAYFVTGNHEYYSNAHEWIAEIRRLGLTVLMNEHVLLRHEHATVLVAGVNDYGAHHFDESHRSDPQAAIKGSPSQIAVKILLAHQPRTAEAAADAGFDLQLSGHTHGGQFFPWNFFVPLQQPFTAGLHRLRNLWV